MSAAPSRRGDGEGLETRVCVSLHNLQIWPPAPPPAGGQQFPNRASMTGQPAGTPGAYPSVRLSFALKKSRNEAVQLSAPHIQPFVRSMQA